MAIENELTDKELKAIDSLVVDLRKMAQAIYLACDAGVAADVCNKTNKACRLINKLVKHNLDLEFELKKLQE